MHVPPTNRSMTRRGLFDTVANGIYGAALASLLSRDLYGAPAAPEEASGSSPRHGYDLASRKPHFEPKAKSVIHLFMNGGPSQMDLFDPKTELDARHGQSYFDKIAGEVEGPQAAGALMRSPFKFNRHGQSGQWVSEVMPHLAGQVDHIALIRSMFTTSLTHEPALWKIHSGQLLPGLPSLGAWVSFGLGTENQSLPAYVVLDDPEALPINGIQNWQAGYLPPLYQGTRFRSSGTPILDLKPDYADPQGVVATERELLASLDRLHVGRRALQPQLEARIASYELAARMQMAASDATDLSGETAATLAIYGIGEPVTDSYGRRCLIARRLIERGVRFVQLFIKYQIWDNHGSIATELKSACETTDKPVAGLLCDLRQRGLLDQTLVAWGGEMGRLPIAQLPADKNEQKAGRDHNQNAMCAWLAGGGVKAGISYGTTDEIGLRAGENRVSVADFHATILHLLGLNHELLYFERNGLKEKLTGVQPARVVSELFA